MRSRVAKQLSASKTVPINIKEQNLPVGRAARGHASSTDQSNRVPPKLPFSASESFEMTVIPGSTDAARNGQWARIVDRPEIANTSFPAKRAYPKELFPTPLHI